jgi:O-antigen/teichoic acid export membrane protein
MRVSLKLALGLNLTGRFWAGAVSFLATPLYLHWLGRENFGLVGFCLLLQAVLGFVSAGLADSANRKTAAAEHSGLEAVAEQQRIFIHLAWLLGLGLGLGLALLSGWLARRWLNLEQLSAETAQQAIQLMALLIALQVPVDLFAGLFLGARRHAAANVALAGNATLRALLTAGTLAFIRPTIGAFFAAQIGASAITILVSYLTLRGSSLRHTPAAWRMTWTQLRTTFHSSRGMTAVAFTSVMLGLADRIVLSRFLGLDEFGIYSLAVTLANLLYFLISPVSATFYPEFSRSIAAGQPAKLAALYHQACQAMAVLVFPAGCIMIFFSRDILNVWTHNPAIAAEAAPVVAVLVGARMIGALNTIPYALQYAHGWVSLILGSNVTAIIVLLPLLCYLAIQFGAIGAASGYFLLSLPFLGWIVWRMHRRLLPGEALPWLWRDTAPSLGLAVVLAGIWKSLEPAGIARSGQLLWLALASAGTLGLVLLANPGARAQGVKVFRSLKFTEAG